MADLTRAQMINRVLERLGVLGAGQSASAEDAGVVGEVLDSVYSQYRKRGLAMFPTSAWPDWAQSPFIKIAAADSSRFFGVPDIQELEMGRQQGDREIAEQMAFYNHNTVKARYF